MKQIRIMELRGTYKGGGGPDKTILLSAAKHDKKRFFVLVTYLRDPKDDDFQIASMAKKYGVPNYVEVFDRSMLDIRCLIKLNYYIRKEKIQIVHVHDLKSTLLGFLLKILNPRIKIMHTAHGWIIENKSDSIKQKIQYMMLKHYHLHIAVSKATKKLMVDSGINPETIKVLYNSIDTSFWTKKNNNASIKEEFKIPQDSFIIGTVGRISGEKDLGAFLHVAQKILRIYPETKFMIVGDGKEKIVRDLHLLATDLGIASSVIFTAHRSDLLNIYASFDLFLTTSLTEGLPNTVLEASSMGVPVIATNVGGVPELIDNEHTGLLCTPKRVDEISDLVSGLIKNPEARSILAANARNKIVQKFSFESRMNQIEKIYKEF